MRWLSLFALCVAASSCDPADCSQSADIQVTVAPNSDVVVGDIVRLHVMLTVNDGDEKALDIALRRAARAYEGFLPPPKPGETFEQRVREHAKKFIGRGEPGASEIMANLFDADYLMKQELVFIGSPDTVAKKIHATALSGIFNVFMGEFNFSDLPEADLMRSIRLFGEKVIPALRAYEPF